MSTPANGWPQQQPQQPTAEQWGPAPQQALPQQPPAQPTTTVSSLIANAGGIPGAFGRETPIGHSVQGTIVETQVQQTRDYKSGEPQWWDDGQPQQQIKVVIQTDLRDPAKDNDDGKRAIYVKWWGDQRKQIIEAVRAAGDTDLRVGGLFYAAYVGQEPPSNPRMDPTKVYEFRYQKPGAGIAAAVAPAPAAPAPAAPAPAAPAPAAPAPAAPAPAADGPEAKIRQLLGFGTFDDATIAQTVGVDPTVVAAVRANG